ncbi:hypothetical protein Tco_0725784 [Tanacetum coccineum]|uniref:Uncharacterized protein n=1 Tax=Tanacetum coccineum TaxID=301880 RepID=A0ABQ4YG19_9ASTR
MKNLTFVNTEFNHQRLLRSQGPETLQGPPSFRFETIPDGLPPPKNKDATQELPSLAKSIDENGLGPFKSLLTKVSASYSPVTCIVADALMGYTLPAAKEFDIPEFLLYTSGASSLICYDQYQNLVEKALMPLKGLVDLPIGGRSFTWMNKAGTKLSKLDRFLISEDVTIRLPNCSRF